MGHFLVVTGVLVTLKVHLVYTAELGASVVLEVLVEVEVDGVVRVGGVTGASDDTRGPLLDDEVASGGGGMLETVSKRCTSEKQSKGRLMHNAYGLVDSSKVLLFHRYSTGSM